MSVSFQILLRTLVTCACPTALLLAMSGFRCSRRTVWMVFALITVLGTAVCSVLYFSFGQERMRQLYFLVLLAPSLVFLAFFTKDRPAQILFNFFTTVNAFYLTSILSHFILGADEEPIWADAFLRLSIFLLILFVFVRYLREPYRFIATNMKKGWRIIAMLPFLFFALVMFLGLYPHTRSDNLAAVVFLYVILCVVYYVIFQVFRSTYNMLKAQGDNDALKTQVKALTRQTETIRRSEEQMQIYRHDMRHYIVEVMTLLQSRKTVEALAILGGLDAHILRTKLPVYCQNTTVNAILAFYLEKAQEAGIAIEAECNIPEVLPVEAAELAMVFANALENAIYACGQLGDGASKKISLRCVNPPHLLLEVSNTFDGTVQFDQNHLPMASAEGHGLGTRSIAAFAQKYNSLLDYSAAEGVFRLRVMLR